jgi:signal transduction histidine kinase
MAKGKSITLITKNIEELTVVADKNTTSTIVRNLINNAVKFTPTEGKVTVSLKRVDGFAEIRIKDTGVGMPNAKVETLFEFHGQKTEWGTEGEKGLGLGLQLVHEFVHLNGGTITVTSKEGKGSEFVVRLAMG